VPLGWWIADLNTYDYNGIKDILSSLLLGSKDGEHYSFNDDISGVLYAFDQTIDQANQYLGAVLGMVGGSFDINAIFTPELLSSLKFLSSFAVRPMQELFYGEDLLPGIFNLLGSFGLTLPDEIKDIKNVTDLFNTSFDILGLSLRIADLLPIIVGVLPALLQNWDQIIDLLGEAAAAPKMEDDEKFTVYNANNVKQGGNVDQDDGTLFGDLEALFNGAGGNSLKAAFTSIKTWFDSIDKQTNTQKDNIVAEYLDKKNFTTSDVNYTNLDNESDEPTTVDYVLHYSHDGIVFAYRIYLTLDSSASTKYYKLAKMEEVTV
jgi:hypothetical protein